ncbi:Nitrogen regulatory protein [Aliiroseovarius sp. xm-m-379]|uniref:PTS sugar transporter subunit IIA n=1 Tax=Aliiroseovarius crassostreae TaxID=154981 RepID=A0A9Q9LZ59_9RHOB|nr:MULTISPECIES: PTS sugar transporter subunit IIA [Aliiroseovarius]NRP13315.1 Nitrogen regulatory protein [Aliiroseovarius sp. xm-d-517]NRP25970.1 Nitrogen regulatory protein [Aliiroseovarius sp. xm-m-379]NRP30337.1 Nitrogen regulatory protein [Aliiroseovarius sp. xm-m-314]NRP34769.1 Nitrogen regulatory protein [Aliiroseovarius sp. xm-a-104]NRP40210.1 Nitrogen regulatory protein [Aliiroseovarius sp. xm-m-339-2]
MELSSILQPSAVKVLTNLSSKKRLFQELGEIAASNYQIDASGAFSALQERETLGPTGVGHGVALPHARMTGLERVVGCFIRVEKPFDFDSVDKQPVDLIFALFAPEDSGVDHLKALALVSRTLRDQSICAKLRANNDSATLHALLTDSLSNKAA